VGWILTAYSLVQNIVMPVAGRLGESFGLLRFFFLSVVLFTVGSMLCALAPNIYLLILARVVQALGGGGFLPLSAAIVSRQFPESRQQMKPIDVAGALTFAGAIFCLLAALTAVGDNPRLVASPVFRVPVGLTAVLLGIFWVHEHRVEDPLVDPALVGRPPFLTVNVYNLMFGACVFSFFSFVPYYAVVQFGTSPVESGTILTPRSLVMSVTATLVSLFLLRLGYRLPMALGIGLISLSLFLVGRGWSEVPVDGLRLGPFGLLALQMGLAGLGMGLAAPAANNAVLDLMPERAGAITGLRRMFRSTGGILGTAVVVLIMELVPDRAAGLRAIFAGAAALLMGLVLPLVFLNPGFGPGTPSRRTRQTGANPRAARRLNTRPGQVPEAGRIFSVPRGGPAPGPRKPEENRAGTRNIPAPTFRTAPRSLNLSGWGPRRG
jgi:MFS family permease